VLLLILVDDKVTICRVVLLFYFILLLGSHERYRHVFFQGGQGSIMALSMMRLLLTVLSGYVQSLCITGLDSVH